LEKAHEIKLEKLMKIERSILDFKIRWNERERGPETTYSLLPRETIIDCMVYDDRLFYCDSYKLFKEEADGELNEEDDEKIDVEYEKSLHVSSHYRG
jgi:hypothetical protein